MDRFICGGNSIEALGTVHSRLYQSADVTHFEIGAFVNDLIGDLSGIGGGERVGIELDLETAVVPAEDASAIALVVNEVATNALKHAFPDGRTGTLTALRANDDQIAIGMADDGIGMIGTSSEASFGTSLVATFGRQLKADIEWTPTSPGTKFTMVVPRTRRHVASAA